MNTAGVANLAARARHWLDAYHVTPAGVDPAGVARDWRSLVSDITTSIGGAGPYMRSLAALDVIMAATCSLEDPMVMLNPDSGVDEFLAWCYGPEEAEPGSPAANDAREIREIISQSYGELGAPRPEAHADWTTDAVHMCTFRLLDAVRSMHAHYGPHPLDQETSVGLAGLCLHGHLSLAPDEVRVALERAGVAAQDTTTLGGELLERGVPDLAFGLHLPTALGWSQEKDAFAVLQQELAARTYAQDDVDQAVASVAELGRLDARVRAQLTEIRRALAHDRALINVDLDTLGAAGLDVAGLGAAVEALNRTRMRGGIARLMAGGGSIEAVSLATTELERDWEETLDARRRTVQEQRDGAKAEADARQRRFHVWSANGVWTLDDDLAPRAYEGSAREAFFAGVLEIDGATDSRVPWYLPSGAVPPLILHPVAGGMDTAVTDVHAILASRLAAVAPGQLGVTWMDPSGGGANAGPFLRLLGDEDDLLGRQVWVEADAISARLRALSDRIGEVHQKYLRHEHADLQAYNRQAGELAEPYHVVVVTGFPGALRDDDARRLLSLAEHGRAAGIQVIVVIDPSAQNPLWSVDALLAVPRVDIVYDNAGSRSVAHRSAGKVHRLGYVPPRMPQSRMDDILSGYAAASENVGDVVISAERFAVTGSARWTASSKDGLEIPVGISGGQDTLSLRFGRREHLLVGGMPGMGKSSLIDTMVASAVQRYGPDELTLYMVDLKQGVGFQPYASARLPHARVVAIQAEREFSLGVLRGLVSEMGERARRFKEAPGAPVQISAFRDATGETMPRILLVIDEFHQMFAQDDAVSDECSRVLERLLREGLAFGIHVVLASQMLSGVNMTVRSAVTRLCRLRLVVKLGDDESRLFLSDHNGAASTLTRAGEAVFNDEAGEPQGNTRFQIALLQPGAQARVLGEMREMADAAGDGRTPTIFDGRTLPELGDCAPFSDLLRSGRHPEGPARGVRLWMGESLTLEPTVSLDLLRQAAANALIVGRGSQSAPDTDLALDGLTAAMLLSLRAQDDAPDVVVVDAEGPDAEGAQRLEAITGALGMGRPLRRRDMPTVLGDVRDDVRRRVSEADYDAPRRVIVLRSLHHARDLELDEFGSPSEALSGLLEILRDGPDFGVHVVASIDSIDSVDRRLGAAALREFGTRIGFSMSDEASARLSGGTALADLRAGNALLVGVDDGLEVKFRPPAPPSPEALAALAETRMPDAASSDMTKE